MGISHETLVSPSSLNIYKFRIDYKFFFLLLLSSHQNIEMNKLMKSIDNLSLSFKMLYLVQCYFQDLIYFFIILYILIGVMIMVLDYII